MDEKLYKQKLDEYRKVIDKIDKKIGNELGKRRTEVRKMGILKANHCISIEKPERRKDVVKRVNKASEHFSPRLVGDIYMHLFNYFEREEYKIIEWGYDMKLKTPKKHLKKEKYLFSLDLTHNQYLKTGKVNKELRKSFDSNRISLHDKAEISKINKKTWMINSRWEFYKVKKTDKQLNIYEDINEWDIAKTLKEYEDYTKLKNVCLPIVGLKPSRAKVNVKPSENPEITDDRIYFRKNQTICEEEIYDKKFKAERKKIREAINKIDDKIGKLLRERTEIIRKMGILRVKYYGSRDKTIMLQNLDRKEEVIENVVKASNICPKLVKNICNAIFDYSEREQYKIMEWAFLKEWKEHKVNGSKLKEYEDYHKKLFEESVYPKQTKILMERLCKMRSIKQNLDEEIDEETRKKLEELCRLIERNKCHKVLMF